MSEAGLSAVLDAVRAAARTGSFAPLEGEELAGSVTALVTALDAPEEELTARHVLGCLFRLRAAWPAAAGTGAAGADEVFAAVLLAPLLAGAPASVPNSVRALLADPETARLAAAYELADLAGPLRESLAAGPPREPAPALPVVWEVMDALYHGTRDPGWLREAADALGRLAATVTEDPVLAGGLESDRAIALWELFQLTGEFAALSEAVTACRSSVALVPDGHPLRPRVLSNACMTLRALYERTGRPQALRDAVELGRQARSAMTAGGLSDGATWSNLGIALRALYNEEHDPEVLQEAVTAGREAVAAVTDDDPVKPRYLTNLQLALLALARAPGQEQLILEAEAAGRRAIELAPAGSPDLPGYLSNHAVALFTYYQATGELDILREAVRIGGESVRRAAPQDGNRARYLTLQSTFLRALHDRTADPDAAEQAVTAARDAVALTPRGHSEMTTRVAALRRAEQARDALSGPVAPAAGPPARTADADAGSLNARVRGLLRLHTFSGDEKYLDEAAAAARRAADLADETDPSYPAHLANVGSVIARIADARDDASLLDEALDWSRQAVAAAEGHEGQRGQVSLALAWVLLRHFQYSGALRDLREAAGAARQAAAALADPAEAMSALAIALTRDYEQTGELGRLTEAVGSGRAAVSGLPDDSPEQAVPLANLATSLRLLAAANDDPALLAEAVDAGRRAAAMTSPDDPSYPAVAGGLARSLESMAERAGDPALYDEALRFHRLAAERIAPEHPDYGAYAYVLAESVRLNYERTGQLSLLDEAVRLAEPMIGAAAPGRPLTPRLLAAAGVLLRMRFEVTGDVPSLERAVAVGRRALRETRPEDRAETAADLCNALRELGEWTSDPAVLAEAVAAGRVAVSASPAGDPYLANRLGGLGGSLLASFQVTRDVALLREAVDVHERAADAAGPPDVHARALSNLAAVLRELAEQPGDAPATLRRAADAAGAAVAAAPDGNYQKSLYRSNFGGLLLALGPTDPAAYREAASVLQVSALDAESPVFLRVNAARGWGQARAGEGDPAAAVEAYALGVSLLPRLVPASLRRADRERQLSTFFGLSGQAAAAALAAGAPRRAVELLEQSRCLLLTEAIEAHSDLAELRARDPGRATQVTSLRERMNGSMAGHGRALEGEWERLLAEVRRLPGLERFLLPPAWDQLVAQAGDGPVVMLTAARDRCDAIVLSRLGPPLLIPLPEMTLTDAIERGQWLVMLGYDDGPLAAGAGRAVADAALTDILGWLWDVAARPVLDELTARGLLGAAADGGPPRLWWCPTGLLTMFPWQAAGRVGPAGPDGVMDRVVSSFCFSVRSLAHTRRPPRHGGEPDHGQPDHGQPDHGQPDHGQPDHGQPDHGPGAGAPLVVSVPFAPGARRLPAADDETRMLSEFFPAALVLAGERASAGTVAAALPGHALVHFACHSLLDPRSPTEGGLLLSDWQDRPFTVRDIADLRLENAELAYLSACSTSQTGTALLDEAVHVTSAFQLAGFRQVVGTLWPVRDQDAAAVARAFYAELSRGQERSPDLGRAAAALHAAVRRMRAAFPGEPSRWGAHVHVGR